MVRWWRLLALPLSGLLLVAGCGGAEREVAGTAPAPTLPPAPAVERPAVPPLGVTFSEVTQSLTIAPLDPVRVRPLSGPHLEVKGGYYSLTAVTPDRSLGVLINETGDLTAVDLARMRNLGTVRLTPLGVQTGWVAAASFIGRSRVLLARAFGDDKASTLQSLLVDLAGRRVLHQQKVSGQVLATASVAGGRIAVLLGPVGGIGTARLALLGGDGGIRTVALDGITAGFERLDDGESDPPRARQAVPGLAVEPTGRRAFVLAAGQPAAEIDLQRLAVGYHPLRRPTSPLRRLASWLVPPAEAKEVSGPRRSAVWVGDGLVAVSGADARMDPKGYVEDPSGLELVDTTTWTVRTVDRTASSASLVAGRLLVWGARFGPGGNRGYGLTVFGPGERRPVHLFGSQEVTWVQVNGNLAYVSLSENNTNAYAVLDLTSQRILHRASGDMPQLVLPTT
jgi:hypothetical protein